MRNFIWTLDPGQDSLYDLAIYLKDFGDELFDKTGIAFRIDGISEALKGVTLSMDWKRHLTLIFKEGMNNILKHAECRNVMLKMGVTNAQLRLILSDDGQGFNAEKCVSGNGLRNMKRRTKEIQGEIKITSDPEGGTVIQFTGEITQMGY
jgi:signal transduction histidine kinase